MSSSVGRQAMFPGLGLGELARLQRSVVALVGCGVLGGGVACHLAMLGVGLVLIDGGVVAAENLANQGFAYQAIGRPKASERARVLRTFNPDCNIIAIDATVETLGAAALAGVDLLVSAVDSKTVRVRLNDLSIRLGLPLLDGAVDGSGNWLVGNVALFDPAREDGACYLCTFDPRAFKDAIAAERRAGCPSWRHLETPLSAPTLQSSAFASVVSGYQSLWALRVLLGDCDELWSHRLLISGGGKMASRLLSLVRNRDCVHDHRAITPLHVVAGGDIGASMAAAGGILGASVESLNFADRSFVVGLECPLCRRRSRLVRVSTALADRELRCPGCVSATMYPLRLTNTLEAEQLEALSHSSWAELGLAPAELAEARSGDHRVSLVLNADFSRGSLPPWAGRAEAPTEKHGVVVPS